MNRKDGWTNHHWRDIMKRKGLNGNHEYILPDEREMKGIVRV